MARYPDTLDFGEVVLRRFRPDMAEEIARTVVANFDRLHAYMPWAKEPPIVETQREALQAIDERFEQNSDFGYAMFDAKTNEFIGGAGLHLRGEPDTREIGYWLVESHTGRGLMTDVVKKLTRFAFTDHAVNRVEIHCDQTNNASASVARRAGFELEKVVEREPIAPSDTDHMMIWVRFRSSL